MKKGNLMILNARLDLADEIVGGTTLESEKRSDVKCVYHDAVATQSYFGTTKITLQPNSNWIKTLSRNIFSFFFFFNFLDW